MMLFLVVALLVQLPASPVGRIQNKVLEVPGVGTITYGISVPTDYSPEKPRPLILALHPGRRMPYYGSSFMRGVVLPGLGDLGAIVVAPDTPASSWNDPMADRAVMALVRKVQDEYAIDRRRVLVTGFSMGGRGTWFIASLGRVIRFVELRGIGHYEMGSYVEPLKAAGVWIAERWGK